MSYQPKGKKFTADGQDYIFGIAEDDFGMRILALYKQVGGQWNATLPVIADNVTNEDIMKYGSVSAYLTAKLETANLQLNQSYAPPKPDQTDKAMCVAYDCALDVDYDIVTRKLKLNKTPPLSHAR